MANRTEPRPEVSLRSQVRSGWLPRSAELARWVGAALGARAARHEVSVLIVGHAAMRRLNRTWRGRDKPTNVLSFPAGAPPGGTRPCPRPLGDLVLCPQVLRREAREQHKRERDHWAHLVVHGTLHLLGLDHELGAAEARRMERREIRVLRGLGIANPYRAPAAHQREAA